MLAPSDDDILNFINAMGIKSAYVNMNDEEKKVLEDVIGEVIIQREFRDLRFAELETLSDMSTVYKVKDFDKLNALEFKSMMKFIYHIFLKNRIIKLYPEEYNNLPNDIKTILYEDKTYHDRLMKSLVVRMNEE